MLAIVNGEYARICIDNEGYRRRSAMGKSYRDTLENGRCREIVFCRTVVEGCW